jgi:hypothetical protein
LNTVPSIFYEKNTLKQDKNVHKQSDIVGQEVAGGPEAATRTATPEKPWFATLAPTLLGSGTPSSELALVVFSPALNVLVSIGTVLVHAILGRFG